MRIIQLSDFHIRGDGRLSFQKADTISLLHQTIDYFKGLPDYQLPDYFVITGDLADGGTQEGYDILKSGLDALPRPWYAVPGNHDKRDFYRQMFKEQAPAGDDISPYICYVIEGAIRSIVIDTTIPGRHYGELSQPVADWLQTRIAADPDTPAIVFTHHPPFATGLPAMDEGFAGADELAAILRTHNNVILCCGHLHTPMTTNWQGIHCVIGPSVAMQMEVDFRAKDDPRVPQEEAAGFKGGGDRFFLGNPAYLIHELCDDRINTHYVPIPTGANYSGPWPFKYYED